MLRFLLDDYVAIVNSMVHFHLRDSKFVVLEPLIYGIEMIEEEEYYCLKEKI